jgi:hypothetical protein
MAVDRVTVNLAAYPDLVMILLGMRVNSVTGVKTLLGFDVVDGARSRQRAPIG